MSVERIKNDNRQIRRVTYIGLVANVVLAVIKVVVGSLAGSMSLVADGIHSISDLATDVAVLVGTYYGSKEPDSKHPYGHGRIETFSAMFVAAILAIVGCAMAYRAIMAIAVLNVDQQQTASMAWSVLMVAAVAVVIKEMLYRITKIVSVRVHSPALYANAWHHRSDAFSSIVVLLGFIAHRLGYVYADPLATIVVGLMIVWVAAAIIHRCLDELVEHAVDSKTLKQIEGVINSEESVKQWHKLRTRNVGREIFLDLHILVDPDLTVTQAHEITDSLGDTIREQLNRPVNITIHVEPDLPELRK